MADPVVVELANKLAEECLAVQTELGEDRLFMELGDVLGTSSQTLEEAFLTAVRTRMANDKGRAFLANKTPARSPPVNGCTAPASALRGGSVSRAKTGHIEPQMRKSTSPSGTSTTRPQEFLLT